MPKLSEKTVEQVFELLAQVDRPVQVSDVAQKLDIHKTTAGAALRELLSRNIVARHVGKSAHGHPPYVYVLNGSEVLQPSAPKADTNRSRPATKRRAKRGGTLELARATAQKNWKPGGRGFTAYQLHAKMGRGSYESVRKAVIQLVASGDIVATGKTRKHSRVYVPAAVTTVTPTVSADLSLELRVAQLEAQVAKLTNLLRSA